jgi:hypothetical protein
MAVTKIKPRAYKGSSVKVEGMKQFRKDIKKLAPVSGFDSGISTKGAGELLKDANRKVAQHIKDRSKGRASAAGRMQELAWASMKVGNAQNKATLTGGAISQVVGRGKNKGSGPVLFFSGAEFGADRNKQRTVKGWGMKTVTYLGWGQFKEFRKAGGNTGYFLFPTMRAETEEIKEIWGREFDSISSKVFPDGR